MKTVEGFIEFLNKPENVVKILLEDIINRMTIKDYLKQKPKRFIVQDCDALFESNLKQYGIELVKVWHGDRLIKDYGVIMRKCTNLSNSELKKDYICIAIKNYAQKEMPAKFIMDCHQACKFFEKPEIKHLREKMEERLKLRSEIEE